MAKKPSDDNGASKVSAAIIHIISTVPESSEAQSGEPEEKIEELISKASWMAAAISGGLALPPGPFGLATILPDLVAVRRIQAQLVSDVASAYGRKANLTPEAMLYCLFRHGSAALFADLFVRAGERIIVKRTSLKMLQARYNSR